MVMTDIDTLVSSLHGHHPRESFLPHRNDKRNASNCLQSPSLDAFEVGILEFNRLVLVDEFTEQLVPVELMNDGRWCSVPVEDRHGSIVIGWMLLHHLAPFFEW